ncbi:MAG: hypothetical protein QG649_587 [Patescibacteria group bacterium]|nr:hypothetical protein [Patescibacteria group bacterium]
MFRRIVSNLSFSPALVGQLGFYAKRLRREEATRRLGLIFTAMALVVQSLAVFSPPEAANAATPGQVGSSPRCEVDVVGPRASAFSVNDNKASVDFNVRGTKNCKVQVSVNAFYAPSLDGKPWSQQILFDRNTRIFDTPGRYTMRGSLPERSNESKGCFYQVDLTYGTHNVLPVLAYGHGRLDCGTATVASASCSSLEVIRQSDTKFTLKGRASTVGPAQIKAYSYTVKNAAGTTLLSKEMNSDAKSTQFEYNQTMPGTYKADLVVKSTVGQDTGPNCRTSFVVPAAATPSVACTNVTATIANRTQAYFTGSAQALNGARITGYTFIVRNSAGIEVNRTVVPGSGPTASTAAVNIPRDGNYTVQLVVQSSLGDKTDQTACVKPFTIAPPATCPYNPSLPASSPDCQPCPDNPDIWIKDERCKANVVYTKTSTNLTHGNMDASKTAARANDKLTYTLTVENKGLISEKVTIEEDLSDVLEYAKLVDQGGGDFNEQTKVLTWPAVTLGAGEKQSRTIAIQMMESIPVTNTGTGVPTSYDCKMANTYGNTVTVGVECPVQKVVVEQVVSELPHTGPRENMIFAAVLFTVVTYFYARSRQLGREVRLIRRNLNTGTI